eukprot:CAMPEP_0113488718 /NCGR_PEP_ID=MMETSP0014_2-20120614/26161_1 /TAXON_ID=2857 /ORGANISM="Nitzschia sp." /LENGTH=447 /DNA_ID=CAMNT_0000382439 /DNA_START=180 /DNA_END=1523 /DNA_ORIENTATION=- /assembly_acc=CAM_ASM_000159
MKNGTGAVLQTSDRPGAVRSMLLLQVIILSSYMMSFYNVAEAFQTTTTRISLKPTIQIVQRYDSPPQSSRLSRSSSSISTTLFSSTQPSSSSSASSSTSASSKSKSKQGRIASFSSLYNTRDAVASALQDTSVTLSQRCHQLLKTFAEVLPSMTKTNSFDFSEVSRRTKVVFRRLVATTKSYWKEYWWTSPMVLLLVPLYSYIFLQSHASMPSWWSVTNMDHIYHTTTTAAAATAAAGSSSPSLLSSTFVLLGTFLGSNIAYFISSIYLAIRFGMISLKKNKNDTNDVDFNFDVAQQDRHGQNQHKTNLPVAVHVQWPPVVPNFAFLALWIGTAGVVSTIFHSVQAFNGSRGFAETLCYVDHAVAITAGLYFWKTCGRPTTTVALIGALSLVTLVVTEPAYELLHSSWHLLSAITATRWALDGYARRIQRRKEQLRDKKMESSTLVN